jgi:putative phosphoesterase
MRNILLISDTHGYIGPEVLEKAALCDEVWHAGDWGSDVSEQLPKNVTIRGVYGNIDGQVIRKSYPKELSFDIDGLTVYMTHIGGYPGKYNADVKSRLVELKPDLYICGHSHICKIMRDKSLNLIHFNPGAIGQKGFHQKRTMMRFGIENGKLIDINVLEYDKKNE